MPTAIRRARLTLAKSVQSAVDDEDEGSAVDEDEDESGGDPVEEDEA